MKRRDFSLSLTALAAGGLGLAGHAAQAQGGFVEGQHFVRLASPAPVSLRDTGKKIEVVEFFWYGCPACNAFEPALEAWVKRLPPDVLFRRVPVGFSVPHQLHQRMFYALESMGQGDALHRRIFAAMHVQGNRMLTERDVIAWVAAQGVDAERFTAEMRSMSVDTRARQARQLSDAYRIDGVPSLGVQGRFFTSGSMAGTFDRALAVTDFLVQRVRSSG
jgi:thiol:disulfide interchange protein DsbA